MNMYITVLFLNNKCKKQSVKSQNSHSYSVGYPTNSINMLLRIFLNLDWRLLDHIATGKVSATHLMEYRKSFIRSNAISRHLIAWSEVSVVMDRVIVLVNKLLYFQLNLSLTINVVVSRLLEKYQDSKEKIKKQVDQNVAIRSQ